MSESKPTLLDAFSGAGGAGAGYAAAGFDVTGIDIKFQPRYCGDRFIQGDAVGNRYPNNSAPRSR